MRIQTFMSKRTRESRRAFTLIELLVVVAIILILIGIGLPNFMGAVTRAKVVKAQSDIRTYLTALDAYFSEFGNYPRDHLLPWWPVVASSASRGTGFRMLTSPIKYLRSLPMDPFGGTITSSAHTDEMQLRSVSVHYLGASGSDGLAQAGARYCQYPCACGDPLEEKMPLGYENAGYPLRSRGCVHAYAVVSIGPRQQWNAVQVGNGGVPFLNFNPEWDRFPYDTDFPGFTDQIRSYTPTNGVKSDGQIFAMTGAWNNGWYRKDGEIIGHP